MNESDETGGTSKSTKRHPRTGRALNKQWGIDAAHALYNGPGTWYHPLKKFPGALIDRNGYLLFQAKDDYVQCAYLTLGKQIHVKEPGISSVPGYKLAPLVSRYPSLPTPSQDVDIHEVGAAEGNRQLAMHLQRERNQALVRRKKRTSTSLDCEVCGFSFLRVYGARVDYCEVHHLLPLSEVTETINTRIQDLAILCANCHRVVHLRNPPYTLAEVRQMIAQGTS